MEANSIAILDHGRLAKAVGASDGTSGTRELELAGSWYLIGGPHRSRGQNEEPKAAEELLQILLVASSHQRGKVLRN